MDRIKTMLAHQASAGSEGCHNPAQWVECQKGHKGACKLWPITSLQSAEVHQLHPEVATGWMCCRGKTCQQAEFEIHAKQRVLVSCSPSLALLLDYIMGQWLPVLVSTLIHAISMHMPDSKPFVRHGKSFFPTFSKTTTSTHYYHASTTGKTCRCGCVGTSAQSRWS